jgi:CHAD domain-containing protein
MIQESAGTRAKKAIRKHYKKIISYEPAVLEDRDPEDLHQMRVGMRRLRSVSRGFSQVFILPDHASEKRIRNFGRTLGELRDLDVLLENLEKAGKGLSKTSELNVYHYVQRSLYHQREKKVSVVRKCLTGSRYLNFKSSLTHWLKKPLLTPIARLPIRQIAPDLLFPFVNALFLHPGLQVGVRLKYGQFIPIDYKTSRRVNFIVHRQGLLLHSLRKQVKRVRYQLSFFTDLYPASFSEYVKDMKGFQDALGLLQDSLVMEAMYLDILGTGYKKKIPTLLKTLYHKRQDAWRDWERLRNKYLIPDTRLNFRKELLNYLPKEMGMNHVGIAATLNQEVG